MKLISHNDVAIISLTKERDSLSLRVEDLVDQLKQKETVHERTLQDTKDELARLKKNYRKSQVSVSEKELTLDKLKADLETAQEQLAMTDLEAKNRIIVEKDAIILELREKLEESYRDFELLSLDWEKLDSLLHPKVYNYKCKFEHLAELL